MPENIHEVLLHFSQQIKEILNQNLTKVIVYGSYARGDYRSDSDVDVMVLTTLTDVEIEGIENDVYDLAFDYQMKYGLDINVLIKNEEHFNYWLGALPFYDNVAKEGVVLDG